MASPVQAMAHQVDYDDTVHLKDNIKFSMKGAQHSWTVFSLHCQIVNCVV